MLFFVTFRGSYGTINIKGSLSRRSLLRGVFSDLAQLAGRARRGCRGRQINRNEMALGRAFCALLLAIGINRLRFGAPEQRVCAHEHSD